MSVVERRRSGNTANVPGPGSGRFDRDRTLVEQLEAACDTAMRLFRQGQDTSEIDAEVDRLLLLLDPDPPE